jgi:hypothetical protein
LLRTTGRLAFTISDFSVAEVFRWTVRVFGASTHVASIADRMHGVTVLISFTPRFAQVICGITPVTFLIRGVI